jgi:hypothetical protein
MIASHPRVWYFSEPFNLETDPWCPIRHMWHHVTEWDEKPFEAYLRWPLQFKYPWWREVRGNYQPGHVYLQSGRAIKYLLRRLLGFRPLLKDPTAIFSAEWLAARYPLEVVVLIRHPAAFASSLKRLNWHFPFAHLLVQPKLMEGYLSSFESEIRRVVGGSWDILDHAILAWRIFHHVIRHYQQNHPEWIFVRHEDLSRYPVEQFRELFARLGLEFTCAVQRTIEAHSAAENPTEAPGKEVHQLRRNSKSSIDSWKHRLLPHEVARIRRETEDIARFFYSDADWQTSEAVQAAG